MRAHIVTVPAGPAANEDAAVVRDGVAVMLDGAGIPQRFRAGCGHSVAWYSHTLAARFADALADSSTPMQIALADAIAAVRDLHAGSCDLDLGGPSATVVAARWDEERVEHLVLSDSSLLIEETAGAVQRITDERLDAVVARERAPERVEAMRNAPHGFFVARHEPAIAREALVGELPTEQVASLRLVSDGVTRATDLLHIATDAELVQQSRSRAACHDLISRIRGAEDRRHEEGRAMPRKVHDDATIVVVN